MTARKHHEQEDAATAVVAGSAIDMLTSDHRKVEKLFREYEDLVESKADGKKRAALAAAICEELTLHAQVEEQVFYPAAKKATGEDDLILEAAVEHDTVKYLIGEITEATRKDAGFDAHLKVLGEYVKHHVKEEEGELFPKVKKSELDLDALGSKMSKLKETLQR